MISHQDGAAGTEGVAADAGKRLVEAEGIVVGDEEGGGGFVAQHVFLHLRFLALANVGRVAHNEVETLGVREFCEHIVALETHLHPVGCGILRRHFEGFGGEIPRRDLRLGIAVGDGDGDAARTRAGIENVARGGACPVDEFLGFGTGDEGGGRHVEGESAEIGSTQNVL